VDTRASLIEGAREFQHEYIKSSRAERHNVQETRGPLNAHSPDEWGWVGNVALQWQGFSLSASRPEEARTVLKRSVPSRLSHSRQHCISAPTWQGQQGLQPKLQEAAAQERVEI
jgi:hypothetical protein